jgi:hypothetical protein
MDRSNERCKRLYKDTLKKAAKEIGMQARNMNWYKEHGKFFVYGDEEVYFSGVCCCSYKARYNALMKLIRNWRYK